MSHDDPDCTCEPGCTCNTFQPWDEHGSAVTDVDGTTTTVQSTNGRYRMLSADIDDEGLFLTIHWQPITPPEEGDPPT